MKSNKQKNENLFHYFILNYYTTFLFFFSFGFLVKLQHTETDLEAHDLFPESKAQTYKLHNLN